ncbi:DUF3833 domain-containing protein [Undibacterium sp. TS12]|uniref:DUF3833 domain-containing protein n=1 Tax=Undibacterium sp. TS12 TaxID=2908202 RepID=UPI001F4CE718|nr:DUF3833 domain-containing protein [Undibacterium sp. TS12]MCH8621321.1 DUF3833 domain-containing protein [Undibacterium sp. TS12]
MNIIEHCQRLIILCMVLLLASCTSGFAPNRYVNEQPRLDLRSYFNGKLDAWGMFQDRSGAIVKRFTVTMDCQWDGDTGTLNEDFSYADGSRQKRVWTLKKVADNHFIGTAADVVGEAEGIVSGNVLHWNYVLALPVSGSTYHVNFDDTMVLMDEHVMLNRAIMTKFGVELGSVTLSFTKRHTTQQGQP